MTINGGDDHLRVESKAVGRQTRYRLIALGAVAIAVLGAVAMAGLLNRGGGNLAGSLEPSSAAFLGATPSTVPSPQSGSRAPSRIIPASSPQQTSPPQSSVDTPPVLADVALPGSPEIVLFQREGDDIKVLGWRPGDRNLGTKQAIHGAVRGLTDKQTMQIAVSPDGSLLLVHAYPATFEGPDSFRVFRLEGTAGREIWQSTSFGSNLTAGFVPTGQVVVTATGLLRRDRGWTIVDLSAEKPAVYDIELPPIQAPAPSASPDLRTLTFNYAPLAMSADGEWVYAMSVHGTEPLYRPAYRISLATGRAEPIDAFPTTGESRVVSPSVDPSGRLLLAGPYSTAGRGLVEAWSAGAKTPDFQVDLGTVFSAVWSDDGGVITAAYDRLPGPFRFRVLSLSATGTVATTFLEAPGTDAALVGVHNGFAAAYVAEKGSGGRRLIVIRLSDGATSGVEVSAPMVSIIGYAPLSMRSAPTKPLPLLAGPSGGPSRSSSWAAAAGTSSRMGP